MVQSRYQGCTRPRFALDDGSQRNASSWDDTAGWTQQPAIDDASASKTRSVCCGGRRSILRQMITPSCLLSDEWKPLRINGETCSDAKRMPNQRTECAQEFPHGPVSVCTGKSEATPCMTTCSIHHRHLLAIASSQASSRAGPWSKGMTRTADEKDAIRELMARYCHGLDA